MEIESEDEESKDSNVTPAEPAAGPKVDENGIKEGFKLDPETGKQIKMSDLEIERKNRKLLIEKIEK